MSTERPAAAKDALLAWYARNRRPLPWRETRDPYAILVSEVMLQQTQVERVVPRWLAWLERWPTVHALANAPPADVIVAWQGLGYNRRAVSLHRTARIVAAEGWPEDLTELPGVGLYTAAAVGNFAFGRDVLPIDTNVRRIQERTGESFDGSCTQALFDLGATICLARIPAAAPARLLRRVRPAGHGTSPCANSRRSRARFGSVGRRHCAPSRAASSQATAKHSSLSNATGSSRWPTASRRCRARRRQRSASERPHGRVPARR